MPSLEHAALVEMFRSRPELLPRLLMELGVAVPSFEIVTVSEAALDQLTPTEFRADLVVELRDRVSARPKLSAVLEVQLRPDDDKYYSWPAYLVLYRARQRCDTCVVVLTPDPAVAAWARRPIHIGPGNDLRVFVLGPAQIPIVTDPAVAAADPPLTVLSAMAHGDEPEHGLTVLRLALDALGTFDKQDARVYLHLISRALGEPMRVALARELMLHEKFSDEELDLPDWWPAFWARQEARKARDRACEVRGEGKALVKILGARGIALTPEQLTKISECEDPALIESWLDRALTVATAAEIFV